MISVDNLSVVFNRGEVLESRAVDNISLQIGEGEFATIIGSNGAGKSTLLAAVAGDVATDSGKIFIDGAEVTGQPAHRRARLVARVFQDPLAGTCAKLTIAENLAIAAGRGARRGMHIAVNKKNRAQFAERLRVLGLNLENRLDDYVGRLSGGQRQALSLVMATAAGSRVLLLDEHTAALDPRMAEFVLRLTEKVCREYKLTTLMVTHSMQSALALGERTIMLHLGAVALDIGGEARQELTPAKLLTMFADACGKNAELPAEAFSV